MARFGEWSSYRRPQRPDAEIVVVPGADRPSAEAATRHGGGERPRFGETSPTGSVLSRGSRLSGKLVYQGPGRIDGELEGEISADDTLVIGESAVVKAQIEGTSIVVQGRVTGDVTARTRLEMRAPARLFGNISTPVLVVQEGVVFEGRCTMPRPEAARDRARPSVPKGGR